MMGKSHLLSAVAISGGGGLYLHLSPGAALLAAAGMAAGVMLPDLDHPRSHASAILGGSRLIGKVFGHRGATHSIAMALIIASLAWLPPGWGLLAALPMAIGTAAAARAAGLGQGAQTAGLLAVLGIGWSGHLPVQLSVAVAVGMAVHVAGDMITRQGAAIFWPLSSDRVGGGGFRAGGKWETWVVYPAMAGLACAGWIGILAAPLVTGSG